MRHAKQGNGAIPPDFLKRRNYPIAPRGETQPIAPAVELRVTELVVPCEDCRRRRLWGEPDNPFHPACVAHLASEGVRAA